MVPDFGAHQALALQVAALQEEVRLLQNQISVTRAQGFDRKLLEPTCKYDGLQRELVLNERFVTSCHQFQRRHDSDSPLDRCSQEVLFERTITTTATTGIQ